MANKKIRANKMQGTPASVEQFITGNRVARTLLRLVGARDPYRDRPRGKIGKLKREAELQDLEVMGLITKRAGLWTLRPGTRAALKRLKTAGRITTA